MSTEIVRRTDTMPDRIRYARDLAASSMLPKQFQNAPANVLWAIEYGDTLGITPMAAINGIHVIENKPSASAALIGGLVRRAGHKLRVTGNSVKATAQIIRSDDPDYVFEVTWELRQNPNGNPNAQDAGLLGKAVWKNYPAAMLKSRAITQVARDACEEILFGLHYTPEELGAEVDAEGEPIEQRAQRQSMRPAAPDPWETPAPAQQAPAATEPPVEYAEVVDDPAPAPAVPAPPALPEQVNEIVRQFGIVRSVTDGAAMRHGIGQIIGTPIASARELTVVQADQVLSVLRAEHQQKQQAAPIQTGPAPVGSPDNPQASEAQQKMMNSLLNQAGYGPREKALDLIRRILARPGLQSRSELSKTDAQRVIDAVDRLMKTGEMPPPLPGAQASATASDEGIDVFDVLLQMVDDVAPGDEASFTEAQQAMEKEGAAGQISQRQLETLRVRLADRAAAVAA